MANTNWSNAGHFYAPQVKPVLLNCSFTVDPTVPGGITGLKGPGIASVQMEEGGNPVLAGGFIVVKLAQNFKRLLGFMHSVVAPAIDPAIVLSSGTLTEGMAYVISSLGTTTTAADWIAAGLPEGYPAAVGASFICTAAGAAGTGLGNAEVKAPGVSNVMALELVGDPQLTLAGQAPSGPVGATLVFQTLNQLEEVDIASPGSVISLSLYLSDSSITVQGQ